MDAQSRTVIAELLARAAYALDLKDLGGLETCFHQNANFTLEIAGVEEISKFEGRQAIMGLMQGALEAQTDERRHAISNVHVVQSADTRATVVSYLTLMATEYGETRLITTGIYTDQVATEGGDDWLIVDRYLKLDRPY